MAKEINLLQEPSSALKPISPSDSNAALEKVIDLPSTQIKVSSVSLSRKNKDPKYKKPIEDFHLIDNKNKIFILMDGATRYVKNGASYPDPSPAANAARLITNTSHKVLSITMLKKQPERETLLAAARSANELVRFYNMEKYPLINHLENDYANACGLLSFIKNGKFFYAYLGDPQGYLIRNGEISIFTENQTAKVEEMYLDHINNKTKSMEEFRKYVCGVVRNNKEHLYSFGSFTGQEQALDLLQFGEFQVYAGDRIILTSDGLLPLFTKSPELLNSRQYEGLFDKMEELEIAENIRSDDKTLIAIDISV